MRTRMRLGPTGRRRLSVAVGCVVLAFGAIVLSRARTQADRPTPSLPDAPALTSTATRADIDTRELEGFFALTQGSLLANGSRELFAELRLTAREGAGAARRQPVALAVALDVSGSMSGQKIEDARRAVRALAARLHPEDQLAVVVYNHGAEVLLPLRPIAAAREDLGRVDRIAASGGTNIPAGLSLAASALSDAPPSMVRRLIVVSDGLDGSGLALSQIQSEVSARASGGVTTSSLGIGVDYDERWLTTVADAGRGNYDLVREGAELTAFLTRELEQASSTVAERAELALTLPAGWRLADTWGAMRTEEGRVPLGALFAGERRRVTLRFVVDAGAPGTVAELGSALRYRAVVDSEDRNLGLARLSVRMVDDEALVVASRDVSLYAEAVAQEVDARQAAAVEAWRRGQVEEATRLTQGNLAALDELRVAAPQAARSLEQRSQALRTDLDNFSRMPAHSREGRAYGLGANSERRSRQAAF